MSKPNPKHAPRETGRHRHRPSSRTRARQHAVRPRRQAEPVGEADWAALIAPMSQHFIRASEEFLKGMSELLTALSTGAGQGTASETLSSAAGAMRLLATLAATQSAEVRRAEYEHARESVLTDLAQVFEREIELLARDPHAVPAARERISVLQELLRGMGRKDAGRVEDPEVFEAVPVRRERNHDQE